MTDADLILFSNFESIGEHDLSAKLTVVADLGPGRPFGATFTPDGFTLYIAD
jgi:hypothetical protein